MALKTQGQKYNSKLKLKNQRPNPTQPSGHQRSPSSKKGIFSFSKFPDVQFTLIS